MKGGDDVKEKVCTLCSQRHKETDKCCKFVTDAVREGVSKREKRGDGSYRDTPEPKKKNT